MKNLKFSDGLIIFLITINVLPVLAPVFQSWGWDLPARVIYFIYSFFCHQIHWRSLHIADHQCAWCARDMAIWGAFLVTATLIRVYQLKGLKWYQILPFMIPIGLDGGIQTIATGLGINNGEPLYISSNLMRAITGSIFGMGLGATIMPVITKLELGKLRSQIRLGSGIVINQLFVFPIVFLTIMLGYLGLIGVWNLTSDQYLPSNTFDSAVKVPADPDLWLQRRANGVCPVDIPLTSAETPDPLAIDCFFSLNSD
jgi:uncharacterized membrane protein